MVEQFKLGQNQIVSYFLTHLIKFIKNKTTLTRSPGHFESSGHVWHLGGGLIPVRLQLKKMRAER